VAADSAALLFYAVNLLLVGAIAGLILARRRLTPQQRGVAAAGIVILAWYLVIILRNPIEARLPDLAGIAAVLGGWCLAGIGQVVAAHLRRRPLPSLLLAAVTLAACAAVTASVWMLGNVPEKIRKTNLLAGSRAIDERFEQIRTTGTEWPWERYWPTGAPPAAVRYLAECTSSSDRLLVTWSAPEFYYFTRRAFAAGHALFLPPRAFATDKDQQQMLSWLRQRPPVIALINDTQREEFARTFPRVDDYLSSNYTARGGFKLYDGSDITIAVRNGVRQAGDYGADHWPCGLAMPAPSAAQPTRE
jgi:hypothetical protein